MKTINTNICKSLLGFGFLFSLILIPSCGKKIIDYADIEGDFYFINPTNYTVKIVNFQQDFNIISGELKLINHKQGGLKTVTPISYTDPFTYGMAPNDKKLQLKIGNRCENATLNSQHSILNINSYVAEKLGERKYKFTYTFTEADYNRAIICH